MNEDKAGYKYQKLTEKVIQAFYSVYNALGYGFLEKVYENALLIELTKMNIQAVAQSPIQVFYDGKVVGEYFADVAVQNYLIVESRRQRT